MSFSSIDPVDSLQRSASAMELPSRVNDASKARVVRWLVWSVWAAMTAGGLGFITHFGSNVPYWGEWSMVDVVSGAKPLTLEWLWSPHNGHRVLLPRLVLLGLYKVSGVDFRVGMYFNIAVLAAASAALV